MKVRAEERGLHLYDRSSGVHLLLDERPIPRESCSRAPAVMSVAVTNVCDLQCHFCYAPKDRLALDGERLVEWCRELDRHGTLEVAFGGGEPTLYPCLAFVCRHVWTNTGLGISVTTNGHHLTPALADDLAGCISVVRFSIDAGEPLYSAIRRRPLSKVLTAIRHVRGRIPWAINTVVNSQTLPVLGEVAAIAKSEGAVDWLLLPEVREGEFTLSEPEWAALEEAIAMHREQVPVRIPAAAVSRIQTPVLFRQESPRDYAHIGADGRVRARSYARDGVPIDSRGVLVAFEELIGDVRAMPCT